MSKVKTEEELAFVDYLLSDEYLHLLKNAIYARFGTSTNHLREHGKAIDLFTAIENAGLPK